MNGDYRIRVLLKFQPMQTTQLEPQSLNNKSIRFTLNDQGKSGILQAFRDTGNFRVTILTEFKVAPDRFRQTFVLLNPCHLEQLEQDPENQGGFLLREALWTSSRPEASPLS
jgi:hypothetical protein